MLVPKIHIHKSHGPQAVASSLLRLAPGKNQCRQPSPTKVLRPELCSRLSIRLNTSFNASSPASLQAFDDKSGAVLSVFGARGTEVLVKDALREVFCALRVERYGPCRSSASVQSCAARNGL